MRTQIGTAIQAGAESRAVGEQVAAAAQAEMDTDRVDFVQVFASPAYEYEELLAGIREVVGEEPTLIGCSSTGEFTEEGAAQESVVIGLVASDSLKFFTSIATGLRDDVEATIRDAARELPVHVEGYPYLAGINLHDGLVGTGEEIALHTQRILGQHVSFAGGSAADDLRMEATHVFCDDQIEEDAVTLALVASEKPVVITAAHGHEPISDPLEVTAADGPDVFELDGRPPLEVWSEAIADHALEHFDIDVTDAYDEDTLFTDLSGRYEFGIDQGDGTYKVRWAGLEPSDEETGHFRFAVNVPEGTIFRVMASDKQSQIDCLRGAAREAVQEMGDVSYAGAFVYECACRALILEEEFSRVPETLEAELGTPFVGFETYGELCMERGQMTGYHNATSVIMLLPE